jgi:hypothetical protein
MSLGPGQERFLARPDHLHGSPGAERQQSQVRLDGDVLLAAEAAAEVRADDADAVLRDLQHFGHVAEVLDDLGGHADRDDAVRVDPRHARLGLEVRGVDELRGVLALDGHRGSREGRRGVAPRDAPVGEQVAGLVDSRGVGGEGSPRIEYAGERLVLDLDGFGGGTRLLEGLCRHQRHRFALMADALHRQHVQRGAERAHGGRLPRDVRGERVPGHVLGGENGGDAGQRRGPLRVELDDAGRGVW